MSKPKYWTSSCGKIELPLFKEEYMTIPCSGAADNAVSALYNQSNIVRRFDKYSDDVLFKVVREIFADYSDEELKDRKENIERILWVACLDLKEGVK